MALARNPSTALYRDCLNYMLAGLDNTEQLTADTTDDTQPTMNAIDGSYISADLITSTDSPPPPPNSPLHQGAGFPTPSGTDRQMAYDSCRGAISAAISAELYERCLNYTRQDTQHYVTSCVEDIKVTVFHLIVFILTIFCK